MAIFDAFRICDRMSCERAIRRGAIVAFLIGAAHVLVARSFTQYADEALGPQPDRWISLDAAFVFLMGILLLLRSRIAATVLLIYFVAARALHIADPNVPKLSYFFALLFLVIFFNAMRATYIWHASYKK